MWNPYSALPKVIHEPGNDEIAEVLVLASDGNNVISAIREGVMLHHRLESWRPSLV